MRACLFAPGLARMAMLAVHASACAAVGMPPEMEGAGTRPAPVLRDDCAPARGQSYRNSSSPGRAASSKRVDSGRNVSGTEPVGPLRCLARMISALPISSGLRSLGAL